MPLFPSFLRAGAAAVIGGGLLALTATGPALANVVPDPISLSSEDAAFELSTLSTFETGTFDESAAEIVAYYPSAERLLVVNAAAAKVDVLSLADATTPTKLFEVQTVGIVARDGSTIPAGIAVNSVAVRADGLGAIAVESDPKTDVGWIVFFDAAGTGETLGAVTVGALPDAVTFTPDGTGLVVANEGEPAEDYSVDPEGGVSVIALPTTVALPEQADVRTADFRAFEADGTKPLPADIRIFGGREDAGTGIPAFPVSENLEPEYPTVSSDSGTAWVSLQEANAIAEVDLASATVTAIRGLGTVDHRMSPLDVSDRDGAVNIRSWPLLGLPMPDTIDSYDVDGSTYLVTANEGDSRDYDGYSEVLRVKDLEAEGPGPVCADAFADSYGVDGLPGDLAGFLADDALGRLNVTTANGFDPVAGCFTDLYSFGTRSFSIWNAATGDRTFDSADAFEQITAEASPGFFNSTHTESNLEGRSDDKGPEPEALTVAAIDGRTYAFVGFERIGGIAAFDITDPAAATFVTYLNNRDFAVSAETDGLAGAGDLGPESISFIAAADSPTGDPLLAVGNEVSGTTTLFRIELAAAAPGGIVPETPGPRVLAATGAAPLTVGLIGAGLLTAGVSAVLVRRRLHAAR